MIMLFSGISDFACDDIHVHSRGKYKNKWVGGWRDNIFAHMTEDGLFAYDIVCHAAEYFSFFVVSIHRKLNLEDSDEEDANWMSEFG